MKFSDEDKLVLKNIKGLLLRGKWELSGQQAAQVALTFDKIDELDKKIDHAMAEYEKEFAAKKAKAKAKRERNKQDF